MEAIAADQLCLPLELIPAASAAVPAKRKPPFVAWQGLDMIVGGVAYVGREAGGSDSRSLIIRTRAKLEAYLAGCALVAAHGRQLPEAVQREAPHQGAVARQHRLACRVRQTWFLRTHPQACFGFPQGTWQTSGNRMAWCGNGWVVSMAHCCAEPTWADVSCVCLQSQRTPYQPGFRAAYPRL